MTFATLLRSVLNGAAGAALACLSASAGQPIQFSSPKDDVDPRPRREYNIKLPGPTLKWPTQVPEDDLPLPSQPTQMDPRVEKKLRDMHEEKRNWLFHEPSLFKDRFQDPFQTSEDSSAGGMGSLDTLVNRVLGKSDDSKKDRKPNSSPGTNSYSGEPSFDARKRDGPDDSAGNHGRSETEGARTATEGIMRSLFDSTKSKERLPVQPGMSLYEMLGSAVSKVQKREEETRRKEFSRFLGGTPFEAAPSSKMLETIISQDDPARASIMNPVTPLLGGGLPALKPVTDPFSTAGMGERPARPLPFDAPSVSAQITAQRAPEKSSQMDALKLKSRPAILEFPGRRF